MQGISKEYLFKNKTVCHLYAFSSCYQHMNWTLLVRRKSWKIWEYSAIPCETILISRAKCQKRVKGIKSFVSFWENKKQLNRTYNLKFIPRICFCLQISSQSKPIHIEARRNYILKKEREFQNDGSGLKWALFVVARF